MAERHMTEDERRYLDARLAEGDRRMERIEEKLDAVLAELSSHRTEMAARCATEIGNIEGIRKSLEDADETCDARHAAAKSRIGKLEANQRWVVLVVLTAVVGSILAKIGLAHSD